MDFYDLKDRKDDAIKLFSKNFIFLRLGVDIIFFQG